MFSRSRWVSLITCCTSGKVMPKQWWISSWNVTYASVETPNCLLVKAFRIITLWRHSMFFVLSKTYNRRRTVVLLFCIWKLFEKFFFCYCIYGYVASWITNSLWAQLGLHRKQVLTMPSLCKKNRKTLEWQCGIWFASLDLRGGFDSNWQSWKWHHFFLARITIAILHGEMTHKYLGRKYRGNLNPKTESRWMELMYRTQRAWSNLWYCWNIFPCAWHKLPKWGLQGWPLTVDRCWTHMCPWDWNKKCFMQHFSDCNVSFGFTARYKVCTTTDVEVYCWLGSHNWWNLRNHDAENEPKNGARCVFTSIAVVEQSIIYNLMRLFPIKFLACYSRSWMPFGWLGA